MDSTDPALWAILWSPIIVSVVMLALSTGILFDSPYRHDTMQCGFTQTVSKMWAAYGILIEPMDQSVRPFNHKTLFPIPFLLLLSLAAFLISSSVATALIVLAVFGGIYLFVLYATAIANMNRHILSQWAYETYILANVDEIYRTGDNSNVTITRTAKGTKSDFRNRKWIPKVIRLAALYLLVMCMVNLIRSFAIGVDVMSGLYGYDVAFSLESLQYFATGLVYVFTFVKNFDAMLGIKSKRPAAWRKVMTSCIFFCGSTLLTTWIFTGPHFVTYFGINPYITIAALYVLFLIMLFHPDVRDFYTPYGTSSPKVTAWLMYIVGLGEIEFREKPTSIRPGSKPKNAVNRIPTGRKILKNSHGTVVFINSRKTSAEFRRRYSLCVVAPKTLSSPPGIHADHLTFQVGGTVYILNPGERITINLPEGTYRMRMCQFADPTDPPVLEIETEIEMYETVEVEISCIPEEPGYAIIVSYGHHTELHAATFSDDASEAS